MDCRPPVVVVKRGTPRKWSSQTITVFYQDSLHGGLSPTAHVSPLHSGVSGYAIKVFSEVLEDDETSVFSTPPDPRKLVYLLQVSVQRATPISPSCWGAWERANSLYSIIYFPGLQKMVESLRPNEFVILNRAR